MSKFKAGDIAVLNFVGEDYSVIILSDAITFKDKEKEHNSYRIHPVVALTDGKFVQRGQKITSGLRVKESLLSAFEVGA